MREELKNFDWHFYGLQITDFDYTLSFIDELMEERKDQIQNQTSNVEVIDEHGNKLDKDHDGVSEVNDDLRYYHYLDNFNIFHFGLWRLQAIFEGILKENFFSDERPEGLRKKLDKLIEQGYSIEEHDYNEVLDWGRLRNALSHAPSEQYRPAGLDREDLTEYHGLVKRIATELLKEKTAR